MVQHATAHGVKPAVRAFRKRSGELLKLLPQGERFALAQQMRRAAVSLASSIWEGHGRYHWQDNTRLCRNARGSLAELVDDIHVCIDEGYAEEGPLEDLKSRAADVLKLLNGYISCLQMKAAGKEAQ
jgi:four helix bundle protein